MSKKNGTKSYMNMTFLPKSNIAISMTAPCSPKRWKRGYDDWLGLF
jgi:hypothetical protein